MIPPKMMETWFQLMSDAMRGSSEAQEAFRSLTGSATTTNDMYQWMGRFMPSGVSMSQAEVFTDWVEQWWKAMGVVPRHRYLEALERNEDLRRRLEDCEKQLSRNAPNLFSMAGQPEDAQRAFSMWSSTMEDMLKMQSEWMQNWLPREQREQHSSDPDKAPDNPKDTE